MLTTTVLTADSGVERSASYYEDGVDDYYSKEGESKSWQGDGAERLGLAGDVKKETFKSLLSGRLPNGEVFRSTGRNDSKTRIGIDFTFQAPKSVSMQALIAGNNDIIAAHDIAVTAAVNELEKRAQTRKKINGKSYSEKTGNLIVAKFRHETNREQEPHLHTHAIAINATQRDDGAWRALVNDELIKNTKFYGTLYKTVLAQELEKLGHQLRYEEDSFELAHITREQIVGMSTRTQQINTGLEAMGLSRENSTAEQRTYVAKATRKAKDTKTNAIKLRERWLDISKELGVNFDSRSWSYSDKETEKAAKSIVGKLERLTVEQAAKRAVQFAINHYTERHTIVSSDDLRKTALSHALGKTTLSSIDTEMERLIATGKLISEEALYFAPNSKEHLVMSKNEWIEQVKKGGKTLREAREQVAKGIISGRLIKQPERFTTQRALDIERRILSSEKAGRKQYSPMLARDVAQEFLNGTTLRKDQREAAELVFCTENRIVGIQGQAGVGKSYMSKIVTDKIKSSDMNVHILAPYGSQKKALKNDGMENARTVASFLHTLSREHKLDKNTVIFVDEAGVLPNRLMDRLCQISENTGARLVLLGDTEQTKAVEAGIPFSILQRSGMETALMNEIQRQKDNPRLLKAVELAAVGKSRETLPLLTTVTEAKNEMDRFKKIANEYVSLPEKERNDTLVVTGTNYSREKINGLIREGLEISSEIQVTALTRLDTTQSERRYSKYYKTGITSIQPEKDYPKAGLERGKSYVVSAHGEGNNLIVTSENGVKLTINPAHHPKLSVYKLEEQQYGIGEKLVITRNDASLDIANGDRFTVTKVANGKLYLSDGKKDIVLDASKKQHLDYAYVTTVHSSQGLTASNVLANVEAKSRTVATDWYYVAISRAKEKVHVYTEDLKKLPAAISRLSTKQAALEINHKAANKVMLKEREAGNEKGMRKG